VFMMAAGESAINYGTHIVKAARQIPICVHDGGGRIRHQLPTLWRQLGRFLYVFMMAAGESAINYGTHIVKAARQFPMSIHDMEHESASTIRIIIAKTLNERECWI
jgi:hypothetical protein